MTKSKIWIITFFCILILSYSNFLSYLNILVRTPYYDNDYKTFYVSLRHDNKPYEYYLYHRIFKTERVNNQLKMQVSPPIAAINMNTPMMTLLLKSLVNLSDNLRVNILIWTLVSFIGAAISIFLMLNYFNLANKNSYFFGIFLLLLWLSFPSIYNMSLGEVSYLVLPFLALSFVLDNKKHQLLGCICLAFTAALKLFFVPFLFLYFFRREWKLLFIFIIAFLVFSFLPLINFSWVDYQAFFHMSQDEGIFIKRSLLTINGSALGVIIKLCELYGVQLNFIRIRIILSIFSLCLIGFWWIYDRFYLKNLEFQNELRFSFLILIGLLCSPLAWMYYFLFLLIPTTVFLKINQKYRLSLVFFILFTLALLLPLCAWLNVKVFLLDSLNNFCSFLSLICWWFCLCIVARDIRLQRPPIQNQQVVFFGILTLNIIVSLVFLNFNYGVEYFLKLNKSEYYQKTPPAMWINPTKSSI